MKPIRIGTVELSNGEKLGYRMREGRGTGAGPDHGNMTSSAHWDLVLEPQSTSRVQGVCRRSAGIRPFHLSPSGGVPSGFCGRCEGVIRRPGTGTAIVMGWSMGGGVAMHLAADRPEQVEKLILLASVF